MNPLKSASPSPDAHVTLRRLYDERVQISQAEFGKKYGIGTQGMVCQYLTGVRPLNVEAAAKFARGLSCTIYDISPAMAQALKEDVIPVLGPKSWWRFVKTAMVLLAISPSFAPSPVDAGEVSSFGARSVYYVKSLLRRIFSSKHRSIVIS